MVELVSKFGYSKVKYLQKVFQLKKMMIIIDQKDQQNEEVNNYVNA